MLATGTVKLKVPKVSFWLTVPASTPAVGVGAAFRTVHR